MRRAILTLVLTALAAGCTQADNAESPSAEPMPSRTLSAADAAACRADGGRVEVRGRIQAEMCVHPFADAGKQCTDNAQCEGKCIASAAAEEGESAVAGACQADDRLFGCYAELENGQRVRAICVD